MAAPRMQIHAAFAPSTADAPDFNFHLAQFRLMLDPFGQRVSAAANDEQSRLLASSKHLYKPPYVGPSGWIGVELNKGVSWKNVIALVARQGLALAAIGIAVGLAGAFALSKTMSSMLFAVSPRDVRIFAVAPITLAIVAIVATLAPALRATRVDPMSALRAE